MSADTGDEAADLIISLAREAWRDRRYRRQSGRGLSRRGSSKLSRKEKKALKLAERAQKEKAKIKPRAEKLAAQAEKYGTPCKVAFAANREELDFLRKELEKANIEHYFRLEDVDNPKTEDHHTFYHTQPNKDGMYELYMPDREPVATIHAPFSRVDHILVESREGYTILSNMDSELRALINDHFSADAVSERIATAKACEKAGQETKPPRARASLGDFDLKFKTVPWDRDGKMICDNLRRAGIPFKPSKGEGSVTVTFPAEYASEVKELADHMTSQDGWGVDPARFINYDELAAATEVAPDASEMDYAKEEPSVLAEMTSEEIDELIEQLNPQLKNYDGPGVDELELGELEIDELDIDELEERYIERDVPNEEVYEQVTSVLEQYDVPFSGWQDEAGHHVSVPESAAVRCADNLKCAADEIRKHPQQVVDAKKQAIEQSKKTSRRTEAPVPRREKSAPTPEKDIEHARKAARSYTANRKRTYNRSR